MAIKTTYKAYTDTYVIEGLTSDDVQFLAFVLGANEEPVRHSLASSLFWAITEGFTQADEARWHEIFDQNPGIAVNSHTSAFMRDVTGGIVPATDTEDTVR